MEQHHVDETLRRVQDAVVQKKLGRIRELYLRVEVVGL